MVKSNKVALSCFKEGGFSKGREGDDLQKVSSRLSKGGWKMGKMGESSWVTA